MLKVAKEIQKALDKSYKDGMLDENINEIIKDSWDNGIEHAVKRILEIWAKEYGNDNICTKCYDIFKQKIEDKFK